MGDMGGKAGVRDLGGQGRSMRGEADVGDLRGQGS